MKILVLSDSHGTMKHMCDAVEKEHPDYVIHLGDHASDAEELSKYYPHLPVAWVCGNCDFRSDAPQTRRTIYGSKKIFACHGHTLGVKSSLLRAVYAAKEANADILLYGHTHIPFCETDDGLTILNPGACGSHNAFGRPTYGVIELNGDNVKAKYEFI